MMQGARAHVKPRQITTAPTPRLRHKTRTGQAEGCRRLTQAAARNFYAA